MRNKSNVCIWKVSLVKSGKKKVFKELYFIGEHLLQISHIAYSYIYGESRDEAMFDFDVDILNISRFEGIDDVVNGHFDENDDGDENEMEGYNIDQPYIAYNDPEFPESMKAQITCTCGNKQNLGLFNFPFTKCHDCSRIILRRDIKEIGGLFIYEPTNNGKGNLK